MIQRPSSKLSSRENRQTPRCVFSLLTLLINSATIQAMGIPIAFSESQPSMVEGRSDVVFSPPAGATILSSNPMPSFGQLGAYYFDRDNQSQVWINLEPQGLEPGPNPIRLNVTVAFPGRSRDRAPDVVDLRAQAVGSAFPTRMRHPILRFQLAGGTEIDLTSGQAFQFISSCWACSDCWNCAADTVIVQIKFDVFRQIAESNTVGIDALGFTSRLKPEDLLSLRKFIDVMSHGVEIR